MGKYRVKFEDKPTNYDYEARTAREALLGMAHHVGRSGTAYGRAWEWDGRNFKPVGADPGFGGQSDGVWVLNVPSPPSPQPNARLVADYAKGDFFKD